MELFQLTQWLVYLAVALFALVRGADTFVVGAKQMGASLGMSKFAIGVLIVGFCTSLPELAASIAATLDGAPEIVIANVVGSNITNILLIVGVMSAFGGRIIVKRDLIKTELPIFFIAAVLFLTVLWDATIDRVEAMMLIGSFATYVWYLFMEAEGEDQIDLVHEHGGRPRLEAKSVAFIVLGVAAVLVGAHFTVEMVVNIASMASVPLGLVSIFAIAIGTSLPELFVSIQAMKTGDTELAIGNIFGSNAFNLLVVAGIPALILPLTADVVVMKLGIQVLLAASLILFVNGLARQIMQWEGMMLLLFFAFFIVKLAAFL